MKTCEPNMDKFSDEHFPFYCYTPVGFDSLLESSSYSDLTCWIEYPVRLSVRFNPMCGI